MNLGRFRTLPNRNRLILCPIFLLMGCGGSGLKAGAVARQSEAISSGVFLPSSVPFGRTYSEWGDEWWRWLLAIPVRDNPNLDETGEK